MFAPLLFLATASVAVAFVPTSPTFASSVSALNAYVPGEQRSISELIQSLPRQIEATRAGDIRSGRIPFI